ncbi:uncharacterized protein LOC128956632 isoform X2 [Oppia nitens]|nr:uncharacterized protein LOC128956632 isoform X2 [Oppia nitens]
MDLLDTSSTTSVGGGGGGNDLLELTREEENTLLEVDYEDDIGGNGDAMDTTTTATTTSVDTNNVITSRLSTASGGGGCGGGGHRQLIVYDIDNDDTNNDNNDSQEDNDDNDGDDDDEPRDKFRSERRQQTISLMTKTLSGHLTSSSSSGGGSGSGREIPDSLDELGRQLVREMRGKRGSSSSSRRRRRRDRDAGDYGRYGIKRLNDYHHHNHQQHNQQNRFANKFGSNRRLPLPNMGGRLGIIGSRYNGRGGGGGGRDLRQFIPKANTDSRIRSALKNDCQLSQLLNLTPEMKYQLDLGILNPNQLLVNALIVQQKTNEALALQLTGLQTPLSSYSSTLGSRLSNAMTLPTSLPSIGSLKTIAKPRDDILITINNNNRTSNTSANITSTKPQIKCRFTNTSGGGDHSSGGGGGGQVAAVAATMADKLVIQQQTAAPESLPVVNMKSVANIGGSGDPFGIALAEVECGIDNDYLKRMKQLEDKRREIQEMKERRRLEMADERLQSAQELKDKILGRKPFAFNR